MRINSNISSLHAQRNLSAISRALARSLERLSSGRRINSARDDASGLAIFTGLNSQATGLARTIQNINEASGYLNAADGALQTQVDLVHRMRELAVQAANGSLSSNDRSQIQTELDQLMEEFNRIGATAEFNGRKLLDGSFEEMNLQVGTSKGESIEFGLEASMEADIFTKDVLESTDSFSASTTNVDADSAMVIFGDLDGDGADDVVSLDGNIAQVYLNDGSGSFSLQSTILSTALSGAIEDFDNDGDNDLLLAGGNSRTLRLGDGRGGFSATLTTSLDATQTSFKATEDFNGDGILDLLNANGGTTSFTVNYGLGNGAFTSATTLITGATTALVETIRDLNSDGYLDVLFGQAGTNSRYIRMGSGSGAFTTGTTISTISTAIDNSSTTRFEVVDMNGDGILDLVDQNLASGNLEIRFGNSSGDYSTLSSTGLGIGFSRIWAGDFDGDGDNDLAIGNSATGTAAIRTNNGSGSLGVGAMLSFGAASWTIQGVEDFNNDGMDDIFVSKTGANSVAQWQASGTGVFTTVSTVTMSNFQITFEFSDINNDGYLDTYHNTYPLNQLDILYSNNGRLNNLKSYTYPNPTASSIFVEAGPIDLNGDGFRDFAFLEYDYQDGTLSFLTQRTETEATYSEVNLETQTSAQDSLEILDNALQNLSERRSRIGALQNRLESAVNANSLTRENLFAAYSAIVDTDLAAETAELVKNQIAQQAATAVLSQANSSLLLALRLLNS